MIRHNQKNNFIKQAGILAIAGIICRMIGILYRSPLTGIIGDNGNSYYTTAYNIYVIILLISSYSIPSAISKEISMKLAVNEYKNAQRVFQCAFIYVFVTGGLLSLFTFFSAGVLVRQNSVVVLKVFAPTIFLSGFLGVLRGYFQAQNSMLQTSVSQIIEQIGNAVISILAAYYLMNQLSGTDQTSRAIYGAAGSAVGTGFGVLISLIFMCIVYFHNKHLIKERISQDKSHITSYKRIFKGIFKNVTPMLISTFIYNFSTSLNQSIYGFLSDIRGIDKNQTDLLYGVFAGKSIIIANIPIALSTAMSAAMIPDLSAVYIQGNAKDTHRKIDTAIRSSMMIAIPAAVGLAVLSRPIVRLLFPQKNSLGLAADLLSYLSITVIFYSLSTITNAILQSIGKPRIPLMSASISLIIQTIVVSILLSCTNLKIYTLVIATIVYSLFICILNSISVRKHLGYRNDIKKNFIIPIISSIIMGVIAGFLYIYLYTLLNSNIISLLLTITVSAVIYFIMIIRLGGLSEAELETFPFGEIIVRLARKFRILSK